MFSEFVNHDQHFEGFILLEKWSKPKIHLKVSQGKRLNDKSVS